MLEGCWIKSTGLLIWPRVKVWNQFNDVTDFRNKHLPGSCLHWIESDSIEQFVLSETSNRRESRHEEAVNTVN